MASVRRLTAILAADVAGYSRLMGADEEGYCEANPELAADLADAAARIVKGKIEVDPVCETAVAAS